MEFAYPKPELLAPAGGFPQLHAALNFGADAVYLATERFGMRARATNFALNDLPGVVGLAHAAGAKVYVTCNILMHDDDIAALPEYFRALDKARVDAFIISDLGAAAVAREVAPRVALHVSTQASVANAAAARVWTQLGARRIVLARELSLAQIAALRRELGDTVQLEAFAHGAMCMAVSGRCLISSYLTQRSGNKGHCTQPCRWNYALGEAGTEDAFFAVTEEKRPGVFFPVEQDARGSYLFNAKDLNMLAHVDALRAAGVSSVKIEGRNKKALYVATVVNAYRHVLDGEAPEAWAAELETVSHRPYGTGFYFGEAEQAADYEGYEQECLHVADVVDAPFGVSLPDTSGEARLGGVPCPSAGVRGIPRPNAFPVVLRCHNRFFPDETLEALIPGKPVRTLTLSGIRHLPKDEDGAYAEPVPVDVANRATDLYYATASVPLPPGSLVRRREFRRTSRVVP